MAALPIHSSCFTSKPHYSLLQFHPKPKLSIRSETPSSSTNTNSTTNEPTKPTSPGLGFGSSSASNKPNSSTVGSKEKGKSGKRERAAIRRRTPVETPGFVSEQRAGNQPTAEQGTAESAFVFTWLGLGSVILVEGIALAASGFLPEEWDKLFVKYLYPSFTPTVGLFVAGSVAYGVLKYLQNEELKGKK